MPTLFKATKCVDGGLSEGHTLVARHKAIPNTIPQPLRKKLR